LVRREDGLRSVAEPSNILGAAYRTEAILTMTTLLNYISSSTLTIPDESNFDSRAVNLGAAG
jgi:hypothetical protein